MIQSHWKPMDGNVNGNMLVFIPSRDVLLSVMHCGVLTSSDHDILRGLRVHHSACRAVVKRQIIDVMGLP